MKELSLTNVNNQILVSPFFSGINFHVWGFSRTDCNQTKPVEYWYVWLTYTQVGRYAAKKK